MLKLDLIQTLAFGGVVLFLGYGIRRAIPLLARDNLPAPIVGGLLVAVAALIARNQGVTLLQFDTTLQSPLMIAFFTSIGFGASLSLLRVGGSQVMLFFGIATVFAIFQNVIGVLIASLLGLHPLFEQAGVSGAASIAVAASMAGIVAGGLIGGPVGTFLVERHKLGKPRSKPIKLITPRVENIVESQMPEHAAATPEGEDIEAYAVMKCVVVILVAMWAGSWVSKGCAALGLTLPAYIGAMLVAAAIRNLDDVTQWLRLPQRIIDDIGIVALSLFLVVALMTLKLWDLAGLALPLVSILLVQVVMVALVCFWPVFQLMGRDYQSAVMRHRSSAMGRRPALSWLPP